MLDIFLTLTLLSGTPNNSVSLNLPPSAMEIERDASRHCAGQKPDDFSMQAACVRLARDGAKDWIVTVGKYQWSAAMQRALARCRAEYTANGEADWSMIGACARLQEQGLVELSH